MPGAAANRPAGTRRRSRFAATVGSFGPVGRVAVTLLLLVPVWWWATTGPFGVIGIPVWVLFVLPRALRDVWRRAPGGGRARRAVLVGRRPRPGLGGDPDSISARAGPTRW
jgi:hypothetical protein